MESPITEFYKEKNVFITGITGFVAKSVVEKLLRLTDVQKIYVLVREKRGKSIKTRMDDIRKNLVFERVKRGKGEHILDKLIPIVGDVGLENFCLSDVDEKILRDNVNVVIHSAASLDFEMNAKLVININLLGTRRILELCSRLPNLKAFVYVSTAYVNANKTFALEKLYSKPGDPEDYVALLKMKEKDAEKILEKLLNGHINSYTVSKALAEHEVDSFRRRFPVAIVRPSMIVGAWTDPCPGWTDSKNGPNGFFMGASLGIIRRLPVDKNLIYDYIPVDIVANELIAAAWKAGSERSGETRIYHCTSSTVKPFSWNLLDRKINSLLINYPLQSAIWYPTLKLHSSFTLFRISTLFLHFLPGIFFDFVLILCGKKPMLFKIHYRVDTSLRRLAPFIFREWFFDSSNTDKLQQSLSGKDKLLFNLDIRKINYENFFEDAVIGVRRYLNKESDETLTAARKKVKIFYFLNCFLQIVILLALWWSIAVVFRLTPMSCLWVLMIVYFLFSRL